LATAIPVAVTNLVDTDYLKEVSRCHWRKVTEKDVVNTTTETDLLNGAITIDAGAMGTSRKLRIEIDGDYLNNSGSTQTFRLKLKLGSTVIIDTGVSSSIAASATRRPMQILATIQNLNATNVQWGKLVSQIGSAAALTDGIGAAGSGMVAEAYAFATTSGTKAVDTTVARLLEVTVIHSAADANLSFRLKAATVEAV
jgi:hypothetical protein